jgi:hypothetical protein
MKPLANGKFKILREKLGLVESTFLAKGVLFFVLFELFC